MNRLVILAFLFGASMRSACAAASPCVLEAQPQIVMEIREVAPAEPARLRALELGALSGDWSHVAKTGAGRSWLVARRPLLESNHVADAAVEPNVEAYLGEPSHVLLIRFTPQGADQLAHVTQSMLGQQLGFLLNGELFSPAAVRARVTSGTMAFPIAGCSEAQLRQIAARLLRR